MSIAVVPSLCNFMWGAFDDDIDDDDGGDGDGDDNGDDDDDLNGLPLSMYLRVKRVWDSHWPEDLVQPLMVVPKPK